MRREAVLWTGAGALLLAVAAATVAVLDATVYSPAAFVRGYLDALASGDVTQAAVLDGVDPDALRAAAVGPADIRVLSDVEQGGVHTVEVAYSLDGTAATTSFELERAGSYAAVFPRWRFARSPTARLTVTPLHDDAFAVGGVPASGIRPLTLLVPGLYTLDHETALFTATDVPVPLTAVGSRHAATIDTRASEGLDAAVASSIDDSLDACVKQAALKPAGCPIGLDVDDRILGSPRWSMVAYPTAEVQPHGDGWATRVRGTAHVRVRIESLFDGSVRTYDRDVPFTATYSVVLDDGRALVSLDE